MQRILLRGAAKKEDPLAIPEKLVRMKAKLRSMSDLTHLDSAHWSQEQGGGTGGATSRQVAGEKSEKDMGAM
jgi:hypothetical protein